ncbi:MAG: hypothetical protein LBV03_01790 [Fusobacteriales bacterium]|jgi:hypothetical protein|nr:hypothetical protein [Fusobacteriales bacterium]
MNRKINGKKILFFIIIIAVCIITQKFVPGIILIIFLINSLKGKSRNTGNVRTEKKSYYNQLSVLSKQGSQKNYHENFAKTEEQKQREKWAKRKDKDPWEWDE